MVESGATRPIAYIVAGAMTDSSELRVRSMETVTAGETARIGGVAVTTIGTHTNRRQQRLVVGGCKQVKILSDPFLFPT
jgi:hypothetical protein